jgi:hypothetical protein
MKENNTKFNYFREYYFLSKFKKKFLSWMWKSKELQIIQKYNPKYLLEVIHNDDFDLDDFLDNW